MNKNIKKKYYRNIWPEWCTDGDGDILPLY